MWSSSRAVGRDMVTHPTSDRAHCCFNFVFYCLMSSHSLFRSMGSILIFISQHGSFYNKITQFHLEIIQNVYWRTEILFLRIEIILFSFGNIFIAARCVSLWKNLQTLSVFTLLEFHLQRRGVYWNVFFAFCCLVLAAIGSSEHYRTEHVTSEYHYVIVQCTVLLLAYLIQQLWCKQFSVCCSASLSIHSHFCLNTHRAIGLLRLKYVPSLQNLVPDICLADKYLSLYSRLVLEKFYLPSMKLRSEI